MITLQQIKSFTESYFECEDLRTKSRKQDFVFAKNMAFYLAKKYTKATTTKIGKEIANKDHATVLHSLRNVNRYMTEQTLNGNMMYVEELNRIMIFESEFKLYHIKYLEAMEIYSKSYEKFHTLINYMINNELKDSAKELNDYFDNFTKHLSN